MDAPTLSRLSSTGPAGDVDVWVIDLDLATDDGLLGPAERVRAERLHEPHRRRWVASAVATRRVLADVLGIEPARLSVDRTCHRCGGPHGRARLVDDHADALTWSMSRSAGIGLMAVSERRRLGVDIERVRAVPAAATLAWRFFAPSEAAVVEQAAEAVRSEVLLRLWARKEAFLKAAGLGLAQGLGWFSTEGTSDAAARTPSEWRSGGRSPGWWCVDLRVAEGFVASLVVAP